MEKYKNLVLLLLVLLIVIGGGSALYKKFYNDGNTREAVKIEKINVEEVEDKEKIPAEFPSHIPLELGDIKESYTMNYRDRGVVITAVTFRTFRAPVELFEFYKISLLDAGYQLDESNTNQDKGELYLEKDGNQLGVVIGQTNSEDGKRDVQIVYTINSRNE